MQLKEFDIILDIKKSYKIERFEVVQGDSYSNVLNITLVDGLHSYDLTGTTVEIVFSKSDGTTVQQTDITIINESRGRIQCILKTNTIASPGKVVAEVRVLEGEILLTSTRFEFYVRKSLINDETIESTNEFPILNQLITDVGKIVEVVPVIEGKLDEITDTESNLNNSIAEGNSLKTDLDNSIAEGNILKPALEDTIEEGNLVKSELDDIIAGTDFEQVITELNEKADRTELEDLAGEGRTDETVKGNADSILNLIAKVGNTESLATEEKTDLVLALNEVYNNLKTHEAENVSQLIEIQRDLSLTGIQTISVESGRKIKGIFSIGSVQGSTTKMFIGLRGSNGPGCMYLLSTGAYATSAFSIAISENETTDRTFGQVTNIRDGSFDINWTHGGLGATGNLAIKCLVIYHD